MMGSSQRRQRLSCTILFSFLLISNVAPFQSVRRTSTVHQPRKVLEVSGVALDNRHPRHISTTTTSQLFSTPLPPTGRTQKKKNLKTFPRYLEIECWKRPELRGLEPVLQAVAESCKQINRIVQRAQTDDLYGVALGDDGMPLEDTNIQGEVQQQLDVLCNTIMLRAFCGSSRTIHSVASEEEDDCRCCSDIMVCGCYIPSRMCWKMSISNVILISILYLA